MLAVSYCYSHGLYGRVSQLTTPAKICKAELGMSALLTVALSGDVHGAPLYLSISFRVRGQESTTYAVVRL